MFFAWWVSHPCVLKALIYKGFHRTQSFFLVINTTVSTWLGLIELMPAAILRTFCKAYNIS
jgi:hypothetical protein